MIVLNILVSLINDGILVSVNEMLKLVDSLRDRLSSERMKYAYYVIISVLLSLLYCYGKEQPFTICYVVFCNLDIDEEQVCGPIRQNITTDALLSVIVLHVYVLVAYFFNR